MSSFTFSGHETFALRISWLPKAVAALEKGLDPFKDLRDGMVQLGLGKNMVRSLQFWVTATGLAEKGKEGIQLTSFAKASLSRESGCDPYLENTQTLWLIHWHLCQGWGEEDKKHRTPYAWYYFSTKHSHDEISPSLALEDFDKGTDAGGKKLSQVTLKQHLDIFLKTYVHAHAPSARSTPEETLDSPLTSLNLIRVGGERRLPNGRREPIYQINQHAHKSIDARTFRYCLHQWWDKHWSTESTATLREVALSGQSPGKCFRMPETAVYDLVKKVVELYPDEFALRDSQSQRVLTRMVEVKSEKLLKNIYR